MIVNIGRVSAYHATDNLAECELGQSTSEVDNDTKYRNVDSLRHHVHGDDPRVVRRAELANCVGWIRIVLVVQPRTCDERTKAQDVGGQVNGNSVGMIAVDADNKGTGVMITAWRSAMMYRFHVCPASSRRSILHRSTPAPTGAGGARRRESGLCHQM